MNTSSQHSATILVVDDAPITRTLVQRFLLDAGYRTLEADNATFALQLLQEQRVDLVICDLQMPSISGIDFTLLVRIHEMHARLPILMLSANTDPDVQEIGKKAGVNEWMGKPFTRPQLIEAVARLLPPRP